MTTFSICNIHVFFNNEYKKNSKKLSFFKKGGKKNIFSIIAAAHGPYLLKNDSQDRILKKILIGIMECNKNSIIFRELTKKLNLSLSVLNLSFISSKRIF